MASVPSRPSRVVVSARALRAALDRLGDALSSASLEGLLLTEPAFSAAVDGARAVASAREGLDPESRAAATAELRAVHAELDRCRRLGASLDDFVRIRSSVVATADPYDRTGRRTPTRLVTRLDARI